MPQASTYLPGENSSQSPDEAQRFEDSKPETWPLLLPSAIPKDKRSLCYNRIIETERLLRLAQLQDNLADLRQSRRALRNLQLYFKRNVAGEGQKTQTKTRTIETSVNNRINRAVRRYCTAYDTTLELDPSGDWTEEFRELKDKDNRGPLKEVKEDGPGDGQYTPSWIWTVSTAGSLPGKGSEAEKREVDETVRHEWMTCQGGQIVGWRRKSCCRRRCDERSLTSSGNLASGLRGLEFTMAPAPPIFNAALIPMLESRRTSTMKSCFHLLVAGSLFFVILASKPSGQRSFHGFPKPCLKRRSFQSGIKSLRKALWHARPLLSLYPPSS